MSSQTNSFAVLNSIDDNHLNAFALDCDILLGENNNENASTLDAMKLEELARAAIAEANYNSHLEEKLAQSHSLDGENVELGCVSNSHRGCVMKKGVIQTKSKRKERRRLTRELKRISIP
jgi:hypothetical protein